jgi:hypothetical protein
MRRFIWPWLGVEAALVLIVGFLLWSGLGEMLLGRHHEAIERLIGETPQAQVEGYLAAARRHDLKAALARWPEVPRLGPEYEARRQAVTQELAALQSLRYRVLEVEWWNTCCEPSPGPDSRNAGLARMWVEVAGGSAAGEPLGRTYIVDVATAQQSYWDKAGGNPIRRWVLRDVYPANARPLFFPLASDGQR